MLCWSAWCFWNTQLFNLNSLTWAIWSLSVAVGSLSHFGLSRKLRLAALPQVHTNPSWATLASKALLFYIQLSCLYELQQKQILCRQEFCHHIPFHVHECVLVAAHPHVCICLCSGLLSWKRNLKLLLWGKNVAVWKHIILCHYIFLKVKKNCFFCFDTLLYH